MFNTQMLLQDAYANGKQISKVTSVVKVGSETLTAQTLVNAYSTTYAQSLNGEVKDLTSLFVDLTAFALASNRADVIKSQNGDVDVQITITGDEEELASLSGKGTINKLSSSAQGVLFQPFTGTGKMGDKAVNVGGETA